MESNHASKRVGSRRIYADAQLPEKQVKVFALFGAGGCGLCRPSTPGSAHGSWKWGHPTETVSTPLWIAVCACAHRMSQLRASERPFKFTPELHWPDGNPWSRKLDLQECNHDGCLLNLVPMRTWLWPNWAEEQESGSNGCFSGCRLRCLGHTFLPLPSLLFFGSSLSLHPKSDGLDSQL